MDALFKRALGLGASRGLEKLEGTVLTLDDAPLVLVVETADARVRMGFKTVSARP